MKTVFFNAKVYVEKGVYAQAVLEEDGIFTAVGTNEEVLAAAGEDAEKIDCEGRTVIPGLNDTHVHLMWVGELLQRAQISKARSMKGLIEICREFAEEYPERVADGLFAMGWNQDLFDDEKRIPDRHDLDKISTDFPILLGRVCGHIACVNTKTLELLGLDASTPEVAGGEIRREADGYPNGIFTENALGVAKRIMKPATMEQRRGYLLEGMKYAVAHGLTSVQSNDIGALGASGEVDSLFAMFRECFESGDALMRFHHQTTFRDPKAFEEYLTKGEGSKGGYGEDSWLTLGPLKLY